MRKSVCACFCVRAHTHVCLRVFMRVCVLVQCMHVSRGSRSFYSVLPCVAVCCSVLQCVVVWCSVVQCVAVCCSVLQGLKQYLQCIAVCYIVLQRVGVCCSALQCVAVCCRVSSHIYSALQHAALCCSVLQCVAAFTQYLYQPPWSGYNHWILSIVHACVRAGVSE